jgi:hypothetical protein
MIEELVFSNADKTALQVYLTYAFALRWPE